MYDWLLTVLVVLGGIVLYVLDRRIRQQSIVPTFTPIVFLMMILGGYYHDIEGLFVAIVFGLLLNGVHLRSITRTTDRH